MSQQIPDAQVHHSHTGKASVCDLWLHQIPSGKRFKHVDATWRQAGTCAMFSSIPNGFSYFFMCLGCFIVCFCQVSLKVEHCTSGVRRWSTPGRIPRSSTFALLKGSWRSGENATCQPACLLYQFSYWEWGFGGLIWFEDDSAQITLDMVQKGLEDYLETKRPLEGWEDCISSMKYLDSWRFHKRTSHQTEMTLWKK